jgi:hypothetical protein
LRKTISTIAAAAVLAAGTFAAAPAFAKSKKRHAPAPQAQRQPMTHPLPAISVLPMMLILNTKKNENFKPYKPYGKKTITSLG